MAVAFINPPRDFGRFLLTPLFIMYPHFAGGSLRHPSYVAAVHYSFTEIDLHRSYILHNIRSIYVHIRLRDVQAICIICLPPKLPPSFCTLK